MGNFYCGTMAYDQTPGAASLYLLTSDGLASQVLTGLTVSNGIGWTGAGDRGFHNDTPTRIVWTFDWSPDGMADRRQVDADLMGAASFEPAVNETAHRFLEVAVDLVCRPRRLSRLPHRHPRATRLRPADRRVDDATR